MLNFFFQFLKLPIDLKLYCNVAIHWVQDIDFSFYFKWDVLLLSYIIAMVHQNSLTVEFWQEKIEGNLRRANTEPSVDFRRANTEPSVYFRKANTEPSVHFRRANTETY